MVSAAAVLGGSTEYAATTHGSTKRLSDSVGFMMLMVGEVDGEVDFGLVGCFRLIHSRAQQSIVACI